MVIKHNIQAMTAQRNLGKNQNAISGNLEKLSSGYKINCSADDASGLAISEKMRCQITGIETGTDNCKAGINLCQIADCAIQEIHDMLNRLTDLSIQSANGTYDNEVDRAALQLEVGELVTEIDRIVESTNFNGIPLLNRDDYRIGDIISEEWFSEMVTVTYDKVTTTEKQSSYTSSTYVTASGGNVEKVTNASTSYYYSNNVSVPSEALSVPNNEDLPYEISFSTTVYNDKSTESNPQITTQEISLTVDMVNGELVVMGSNGKNYAEEYIQNTYDVMMSTPTSTSGLPFVQGDANNLVSAADMKLIMEDLMKSFSSSSSYDVAPDLMIGGAFVPSTNSSYYGDYYKYYDTLKSSGINMNDPAQNPFYGLELYTSGSYSGYPIMSTNNTTGPYSEVLTQYLDKGYGPSFSFNQLVSYEDLYNANLSKLYDSSSGSVYGSSMRFYGSYTSSGRVLGVEIGVTSGGNTVADSTTPNPFDGSEWNNKSDMLDIEDGAILGVTSVPEPSRTEIKIGEYIPTAQEVLTMINSGTGIDDLIVTITAQTTDSSKNEEDVYKTEDFVLLYEEYNQDVQDILEEKGINVVWTSNTTDDTKHLAVEDLCSAIGSKFGTTATRKLDSNYDVSRDDNELDTTRYVIQIGNVYQTRISYTTTTTTETVTEEVEHTWAEYEYAEETTGIIIQMADKNEDYDQLIIHIENMQPNVESLLTVDVSTQDAASASVDVILENINDISLNRAYIGSYQNRLTQAIQVNQVNTENLQAAESTIRDTDFAAEMMEYTKNNILTESSQSMLAHANGLPEIVLQLLG